MVPCIHARVSRKARHACDTFHVEISATEAARFGMGLDFWADPPPADITVMMSMAAGGGDHREMITGQMDCPEICWEQNTIQVSGRDKSASLTEKKRNQKYLNKKSSDIVRDIAKDHGLEAQASAGSDNTGQKYDKDTAHLVLNRSDFETMSDLAEREGFRWYVDGKTLFFEPDDQSNGSFSVFWKPPSPESFAVANVLNLRTSRNMTAARQQKHTVRSWHHKDKKVYEGTAEGGSGESGEPVEYEHHHNGYNQEQVTRLAKARLKNSARHNMCVSVTMPGDLSADVRQTLNLSGTGTIFDSTYDIDEADFEISWGSAFVMHLTAKSAGSGGES